MAIKLATQTPHVLIFPLPAQGNVNPMLKLGEMLCMAGGIHVTFLNSEFNQCSLFQSSDVQTRFARFPEFRFRAIPDGLPSGHNRTFVPMHHVLDTITTSMQQPFREMLSSHCLESETWPPVSCIIADGLLSFTVHVAKEMRIPYISFRTASACYFWACFCIPELIQHGEIPFGEDHMDEPITTVPSMVGVFRRRDLPNFCRAQTLPDTALHLFSDATQDSIGASAQIFNTFEDLEGPILSHIRTHIPKVYTIGPLDALLRERASTSAIYNNLLEIDRSCMQWLHSQPRESVLYVSIGSVAMMTHRDMLEIWHGLVNSGVRFLWVVRPNSVTDRNDDNVPERLLEETKERGCIVGWSPQEEVLKHQSVGGFMTHSGWNSTLESIVAGVPMICWPSFADQQTNSRFVSEVWKVGLDMKDTCDRKIVERMVRDLMVDKNDAFKRSVQKMAEKAKKSVAEGGSSYTHLDKLIQDIKCMSI